ncbi:MAG: cysteine desulfurase family protein, partial [Nannocystaceae bacterium]
MTTPQQHIYLDYAATCPVDPAVLEQMLPFFSEQYGNAASRTHAFGWEAEEAVSKARDQVASVIGADGKEIAFTSGATESNNLALKGVVEFLKDKGNHVITVVTEHKAVLDTGKYLERNGASVTYLPVDSSGLVSMDALADAMRPETVLVSVMFANNETGVVQPIAEIGALCRSKGVMFHTDAVQAFGKVPIDVNELNIDLMSISAHKIYG